MGIDEGTSWLFAWFSVYLATAIIWARSGKNPEGKVFTRSDLYLMVLGAFIVTAALALIFDGILRKINYI